MMHSFEYPQDNPEDPIEEPQEATTPSEEILASQDHDLEVEAPQEGEGDVMMEVWTDDPRMNDVYNTQATATLSEIDEYLHDRLPQYDPNVGATAPSRAEIDSIVAGSGGHVLEIPSAVRTKAVAALGSLMLLVSVGSRSANANEGYWWYEEPAPQEVSVETAHEPQGGFTYVRETSGAPTNERPSSYERRMDARVDQTIDQGARVATRALGGRAVNGDRELSKLQTRGAKAAGDALKENVTNGWTYAGNDTGDAPGPYEKKLGRHVDRTIDQGVKIMTRSLGGQRVNSEKEARRLQQRGAKAVGDALKLFLRGDR